MRTTHAIIVAGIVAGVLIGLPTSAAILLLNRYEVAQPFNALGFNRYDRWTGRVEQCSSYYDNKTYCGGDLWRRMDEAAANEYAAAMARIRQLGYTQDEIDHWPKSVREGAKNIAANGGSDASLNDFIKSERAKLERSK